MLLQSTNPKKHMDADHVDSSSAPSGRIQGTIFGFFLLAFGMPFTLVPLLIFGDGSIDIFSFPGILMVLFTLPFVGAGLFVQFIGFSIIRVGLNPHSKKNTDRLNKVLGQQPHDAHQEYWRTDRSVVADELDEVNKADEADEGPSEHVENFWDTVES